MDGEAKQFAALIVRLRGGDEEAAQQIAKRYESEVRRFIRFRLTSPSIRRLVESLDIYQSVLARFFVGIEQGNLEAADPEQLRRLLLTMARNKILDQVRHQHADRRDARRNDVDETALAVAPDSQSSPSAQVETAELVAALRSRLSPDEEDLLNRKLGGQPWNEIATEIGGKPDALRKRLSRAVDQAARGLGLLAAEAE